MIKQSILRGWMILFCHFCIQISVVWLQHTTMASVSVIRSAFFLAFVRPSRGWIFPLSRNSFTLKRRNTSGELEFELVKNVGSKFPKSGDFTCAGCNTPLYKAMTKFDSGCGWPAFFQVINWLIIITPIIILFIMDSYIHSHFFHSFRRAYLEP